MSSKVFRVLFVVLALGCLLVVGIFSSGCSGDLTMSMGRCADDGNPCTNSNCTAGETKQEAVQDKTACALGANAGICMGGECELDCASDPTTCQCVTEADCPKAAGCDIRSCEAGRCTDTLQKGCRGAPCVANDQCDSGFCTDGVCCESACTETCKSCAVAGNGGVCDFVPLYSNDEGPADPAAGSPGVCSAVTMDNVACNGKGECLKLAGSVCSGNGECLSQGCVAVMALMVCLGAPGDPCTESAQCQSKSCVGGECGKP